MAATLIDFYINVLAISVSMPSMNFHGICANQFAFGWRYLCLEVLIHDSNFSLSTFGTISRSIVMKFYHSHRIIPLSKL